MTQTLHREVETLLRLYARDLAQISPSGDLDARIGELVAGPRLIRAIQPANVRWMPRWAAAACIAVLAIVAGVFIGVSLERRAQQQIQRSAAWTPADFSMWPADSVALQIPAEYSAAGTLVAIEPNTKTTGKRYWIDVVVSNDGTMRIYRVVPAEVSKNQKNGGRDGITLQTP